MYSKYKYKFYLNINHAIYIQDKLGETHPHTWELILSVKSFNKDFVQFNMVEKTLGELLGKYQNKNINKVEPFDKINPTLENVCEYLNTLISNEMKKINIMLDSIEMCESPKCSFIIENYDTEDTPEEELTIQDPIVLENNKIIDEILSQYIK